MAQQYDMNGAEARVFATHDRLPGIVENAHAGRVFKDRRAVAVAQLARMRTERRNFDVLRPCSGSGNRERNCKQAYGEMFHIHASSL